MTLWIRAFRNFMHFKGRFTLGTFCRYKSKVLGLLTLLHIVSVALTRLMGYVLDLSHHLLFVRKLCKLELGDEFEDTLVLL